MSETSVNHRRNVDGVAAGCSPHHQRSAEADLIIIPDSGHSAFDPTEQPLPGRRDGQNRRLSVSSGIALLLRLAGRSLLSSWQPCERVVGRGSPDEGPDQDECQILTEKRAATPPGITYGIT